MDGQRRRRERYFRRWDSVAEGLSWEVSLARRFDAVDFAGSARVALLTMRELARLTCLLPVVLLACGGRTAGKIADPIGEGGSDAGVDAGPPPATRSEQLDVLLVVDNTPTAAFTHDVLANAIPYLMDRLTDPRCVNGLGQIVDSPAPNEECVVGQRDFAPVQDVHIGVISTSIGGHGADSCSPQSANYHPDQNQAAHLLHSGADGMTVPTYEDLGFLFWDPSASGTPPGESAVSAFNANAQAMIQGVGNQGCGFEAPLEAMYRFLIDPNPYQSIEVKGGNIAVASGTDTVLLDQRADFLRPDSAVLVVLLSDENDCSTRDGGQFFFSNQNQYQGAEYHLPRARGICQTDPDDPCCTSCGAAAPQGCPASDPQCALPPLSAPEDPINLRCFDQKRRFGLDFLYPIARYVDGLTADTVSDRDGVLQPNPLLLARSPKLVVVTALAGVPWQDIALSTSNIGAGFTPTYDIDWGLVLGADGAPPTDALMIPSRVPRSGTHPLLEIAIAPPSSTSPDANFINGHEHDLGDTLQYACIYPLAAEHDCSDGNCDCDPDGFDTNPVCQADTGEYSTTQRFGRATPAPRQLELVRALGSQGELASVCISEAGDTSLPYYGFKPAVDAMLRGLRNHLAAHDSEATQ